jgi:RNA polymerase sigma-70 factor (ECF subfamily)
MLYRRTGDRDRAEDLAHEVFARALATPPDNPRPWLFAVALNLVRDDGRRAVRQGRRLQLLKAEITTTSPGPEHDYEKEQQIRAVRAALDEMNERDRDVLLLKAEGRYDEIAATTGLAKEPPEPRWLEPPGRGISKAGKGPLCRILTKATSTPCWMAS